MNLALFDLSIISFAVARFKKETGLPVSTVSCIIWLSILTMAFSDFTLFNVGSRIESIFWTCIVSPFDFFLFSLIFRDSFVLRLMFLYRHHFKITTWTKNFSYLITFLYGSFRFFRNLTHLLRATHFCKVIGFSSILTSFAHCGTVF